MPLSEGVRQTRVSSGSLLSRTEMNLTLKIDFAAVLNLLMKGSIATSQSVLCEWLV